ncbi:hypothetical protein C8A00DRAFT_45720 [Chaetomidium leptoderma]|uniref:rRNA adenine N(6)-methyltransferase n=1 Tax=Chaetomidium leptoderma TaxID=669021 RepID=A0AAN6ZUW8_9PEZI|nr:hypothetical protein C8A00DRAFT_45720 [Chaetomidium leptoderma]
MKIREDAIKSVGLTLLYEPDWPTDPAVDIVLVHGIGGHPVRSWKCEIPDQTPTAPKRAGTVPYPGIKRRLTKLQPTSPLRRSNSEPLLAKEQRSLSRSRTLRWKDSAKSSSRLNFNGSTESIKQSSQGRSESLLRKASAKSSPTPKLDDFSDPVGQCSGPDVDAYWPLEFLPASCPNARVFTWGYHTLVADKKPLRLQGDIFAHAGELLVELAGTRAALGGGARPIIFVAHSTGGVLVKELLRLSEAERDGPLKGILMSTSAVVFLGGPHRDTEHCNLGDAISSMASVTLSVDPNEPVLQELCGANSAGAELGRQTFVRFWNDYNFKVKTFQESVIPSYQYPELRAETTIRRLASFIGDPREKAETICALHDDICKFSSAEDSGYHALAKTLAGFITGEEDKGLMVKPSPSSHITECLSALIQPQLALPETHPATSYPGTCLWLYDLHDFQAWHHRTGGQKHKILWIRGESGCDRQWGPAGASFIWATAEADDGTRLCLPGQQGTSPADARLRTALLALYNQPRSDPRTFDDAQVVSLFADYYVNQKIETPARRTFIFVEIADDACPAYVHELLGRLSHLAHNSDFNICVASGYNPEIIEEENVISIPMHLRNSDDVLRYVNLNLVAEWEERNRAVMQIGKKSGGVFLWAEIVVNILNAAIIEGATQEMIEYTLEEVPGDLHGLYEWMLSTLNDRERAESLLLFQWVILAAEPMRLNDLFLAVRLTEPNPFAVYKQLGPLMALDIGTPFSMRELRQLRNSEISSDTPYQFHCWLRARSIGLLELKSDNRQATVNEPLGLQRVQPIHSSVRSFFLSGRGFACLAAGNPSIPPSLPLTAFLDITHYALLRACLTYLNMRDFESLGHGASRRRKPSSSSSTSHNNNTRRNHNHDLKLETTTTIPLLHWHPPPTVSSQRHLIMSSYPFLQYAVTHLVHHLLAPQPFRYSPPQHALLRALSANRFRLWKRWTSLLGTYDPDVILAQHAAPGTRVAAFLSPVYGARYRLERVLRKLGRLAATKPEKPDVLRAENEVAARLRDNGTWAAVRGRRKGQNTDKYRINVINEKLCDDIVEYIKPTLKRHEGCDLIDIFPGAGIWSRKLNDVLKPRSHLLMEPDEVFYRPFLEPLLERPGTKLLPESGIVWEQLNTILNPASLPHQTERRYAADETPQRNDTLLVTMNLSMYPKRKFRTFDSLAQLVLFQVISGIRPGALFQKYGLVRMLIWTEDQEKGSVVPRTVQRRRKMAIESELSTDYVCEIAGGEAEDLLSGRPVHWYRRDEALDFESTQKTLDRMKENGFVIPPGREPLHVEEFLEFAKLGNDPTVGNKMSIERPFMVEMANLETAFANGEFEKGSKPHMRMKVLGYLATYTARRFTALTELVKERDAAVQAYLDAGTDKVQLRKATKLCQAWSDKVNGLEKTIRAEVLLACDNLQVLRQDPPVLNWDRRYAEPLRTRPNDFFPQVPCTLLDIQPKAVAPVLRDMGPNSTRGGDMFDLILRGLVQRSLDPVSKSLNTIYAGAGEGVMPHCPSLGDPRRGGSPMKGMGELSTRTLSEKQLIEITEGWLKWPFKPEYSELVSRTVDDIADDDDEGTAKHNPFD